MTATSKVVAITDKQTGEQRNYVRYSARLESFLKDFPLKDGWARTSEPISPHEIAPQYAAQYELFAAQEIEAGRRPPILCAFRAKLTNPTGVLVASAHATGLAYEFRDISRIETGAQQRLIATCGYGSEAFDGDEEMNLTAPAMAVVTPKPEQSKAAETVATPAAAATPPGATVQPAEASAAQGTASATAPHAVTPAVPASTPTSPEVPATPTATARKGHKPKAQPDDAEVPEALRRQITARCKARGIALPELKNLGEARRFNQSLFSAAKPIA